MSLSIQKIMSALPQKPVDSALSKRFNQIVPVNQMDSACDVYMFKGAEALKMPATFADSAMDPAMLKGWYL
jgi:hypothetical protein